MEDAETGLTIESMRLANRHHQAGRATEAVGICLQVLAREPHQPDALHLLGIMEAQAGRLDVAADLLRRSVAMRPDFPLAWSHLGCILVHLANPEEALAAYDHVVQLEPADALGHHARGILLRDLGRTEEALAAFTRATELRPDFAESHFKLGLTLRKLGRTDEAVGAYSRAIELKPDFPDAYNNLGNALRDTGRLIEAIAAYQHAIRLKPTDATSYLNLGNALIDGERFAEAVSAYQHVIQLAPACHDAHRQLGVALANLQRFDEARRAHQRALQLCPTDACGYESLGVSLLLGHDVSAAEACFCKALQYDPESAAAWNGLGMSLRALGQLDESLACLRHATEIDPDKAFFHKCVADATRQAAEPATVQTLRHLLDREDLPESNRVDAGFALGKLLDDAACYDEAFAAYAKANFLLRASQAAAGHRFDGDALRMLVDQIIEHFTPEFFAERRDWGACTELPVFIVGMPRSGTTLLEQIAASHKSVFGAGELQYIENAYVILGGRNPTTGRGWTAPSIAAAARAHLDRLRAMGGDAVRVIDKMPGNVFHLGLIALLFPRARVVICRRDGRDTCLSCFFQHFGRKSSHLFKYDLADCGRQFVETERLMSHWRRVLPLDMLEVQYEQVVANLERESRRLLEFLGLPWDPACLDFHRGHRIVVTASACQVRQPVYTRSVGRWRNYRRHLGPLLEVLQMQESTARFRQHG